MSVTKFIKLAALGAVNLGNTYTFDSEDFS
jgi:hypothetical protein